MQNERIFSYKIKDFLDISDGKIAYVLNELSSEDGVVSAEEDREKGCIVYSLTEWASDYDILVRLLKICEDHGVELLLDEDAEKSIENEGFTEEVPEYAQGEEGEKPKKEEKTNEKPERLIVIGLSVVALVTGLFFGGNYTVQSWIFTLAFAFAAYETLYAIIVKAFAKEYFFDEGCVLAASLVVMYLGKQITAVILMLIYSLFQLAIIVIKEKNAAIAEEYKEDEEKKAQYEKFSKRVTKEQKFLNDKKLIISLSFIVVAALISFIPPFFAADYGKALVGKWLYIGAGIIVLSSVYPLIAALRLANLSAGQNLNGEDLFIKDTEVLEKINSSGEVVFDKTGVLTLSGAEIVSEDIYDEKNFVKILSAVANKAEHPLFDCIRKKYPLKEKSVDFSDFSETENKGISCVIDGKKVFVGNKKLMTENKVVLGEYGGEYSPLYVAVDGELAGALYLSFKVIDNARGAVMELRNDLGLKVTVLSSDALSAVNSVKEDLGTNKALSSATTEYKVKYVSASGRLYVGNAECDGKTLSGAALSFSIGKSESASAYSTDGDVKKVPRIIKLARRTAAIFKQNAWIFCIFKALSIVGAVAVTAIFGFDCLSWFFALDFVGSLAVLFNSLRNKNEAI
ncbi:MAG: cation-translocating P-type ATPase [Clostridia bacterium]|nr:cation-translocating P-type ATPase [Clostridia bacterium]